MIRVVFGEKQTREAARPENIIVVIDALRASTTLAALLRSGAEKIRVCPNLDAVKTVKAHYPDSIVVGEWHNKVPANFDYDNSPTEILGNDLSGKEITFLSTNGARMLVAANGAKKILVGSLPNATVLANAVVQSLTGKESVILVAAGDLDQQCDEDSVSASILAEAIGPEIDRKQESFHLGWRAELADRGIESIFRESKHGKELLNREKEADLIFCSNPDTLAVVPEVFGFISLEGFTISELQPSTTSK